jgi:hypothetical protein
MLHQAHCAVDLVKVSLTGLDAYPNFPMLSESGLSYSGVG